ncbi:ATP-binding protein, partial [Streptococcus pyogenes]
MKKTFLKVAQDGHFFDKHQNILVAVSGGNDSMALLEYLLATKDSLGLTLGIAHVNHKQRLESDDEEKYLKEFANQHGIP